MDDQHDVSVYRPPGWAEVAAMFERLPTGPDITVGRWLADRGSFLLTGWQERRPAAATVLSNWHPELIGRADRVFDRSPDLDDCRLAVAREVGFDDWAAVQAAGSTVLDHRFEAAVDGMLAGRSSELAERIQVEPDLVTARSAFAHGATLLHYLAANGVETERQVVPLNGAELIALLLRSGADPSATMAVYGGRFTALELLTSSAHPFEAGVGPEMAEALSRPAA